MSVSATGCSLGAANLAAAVEGAPGSLDSLSFPFPDPCSVKTSGPKPANELFGQGVIVAWKEAFVQDAR